MKSFAFDLKQVVKISESGEQGTIIGRAEYTTQESQYLIRYRTAEGRATEAWWGESAIEAV